MSRTDVGAAVVEAVDGAMTLTAARAVAARALRRRVTLGRDAATSAAVGLVDELVRDGRLTRDDLDAAAAGDRTGGPASRTRPWRRRWIGSSGRSPWPRHRRSARPRTPPAVRPTASARSTGRGGSVVLEPDLAYASSTYRTLEAQALAMSSRAPLTPAAFRDATGTSRKYVMAILADLDRRGILRRTDAGHVPGPRAAGRRRRMTTDGISVIVLAGGRSSRFGRDKLAEPVDGRPLVHHAIDAVRPIATEIIVVAAPGANPALPMDVTLVHDAVAFEGPLAGLLGGTRRRALADGPRRRWRHAGAVGRRPRLDGRAAPRVRRDRAGPRA